jgi:transposase
MFGLGPATRVYLAAGVTDMRKGFEGLYLVRDQLSCEPLSGHLVLFCKPICGSTADLEEA